jgi:hypothetical protein
MRARAATALVVAAVLAVAGAAVLDSVRPRPVPPLDAAAAAQLRELGVTGTLVYTDTDCKLHALALPGLRPARVPEGRPGCEISVSPDGTQVAPEAVRWSRDGDRRCYRPCAWRGDELTFWRSGSIRSVERVLVPLGATRVLDLAWTSPREVVALLDGRAGMVVAGFRNGRLAWQAPRRGRYDRLVVSSGGEITPVTADRGLATVRSRIAPRGPADWSPDGRRLLAATRTSLYVLDPAAARSVRIPLTVRDVAWR